jgi:hypothetical protein
LIHAINIDFDSNRKKIEDFIKRNEAERGELERVIVSIGTVRVMARGDQIPIPTKPAVRGSQ